jgi:deoxyribonuclease V
MDALRHRWDVSPAEARAIQATLARRVSRRNARSLRTARRVGGVDVSFREGWAIAAIVVLDRRELEPIDAATACQPIAFPYVPGLLSFRECPPILAAWELLREHPDALLIDGQGYAHPRRFGLACHLGMWLDVPTVGCAKTRLVGDYDEPAAQRGSASELRDGAELIGAVVRTRTRVRPLFVSVGHRFDLDTAIAWTLASGRGYRLPEPTRLAHLAAGKCATPPRPAP